MCFIVCFFSSFNNEGKMFVVLKYSVLLVVFGS